MKTDFSDRFRENPAFTWTTAGTGDVDANGISDIFWRNSTTGDFVTSLMNGPAITSSTFIANVPLNFGVAGVGDFNGDGKSDILWRDTNGDIAISH